jgi:hypothetical protein
MVFILISLLRLHHRSWLSVTSKFEFQISGLSNVSYNFSSADPRSVISCPDWLRVKNVENRKIFRSCCSDPHLYWSDQYRWHRFGKCSDTSQDFAKAILMLSSQYPGMFSSFW